MHNPVETIATSFRSNPRFNQVRLDEHCSLYLDSVPDDLQMNAVQFEQVWLLHPENHHEIWMINRFVKIPRWQATYGADYYFSGSLLKAEPVPSFLLPWLEWVQSEVDGRFNGILVNWYGGPDHYIGKHRDSMVDFVNGAPIVTISFGETRTFRMRPCHGKGLEDFVATPGSVIIIPQETNEAWTHEVVKRRKNVGRRISLTFRAFRQSLPD